MDGSSCRQKHNDGFDFNSLDYLVYRRYIELLSAPTKYYFKTTSKNNYNHCLDIKKIETGFFNALPYSVYSRYIELLSAQTNHHFRKTSKRNYYHCFDVRGIEAILESGVMYGVRKNYRVAESYSDLSKIRSNWTKYLVATDRFWARDSITDKERLNFVKKYSGLHVSMCAWTDCFEQLIHPGLEIFKTYEVEMTLDQLLGCLKKLDVCKNLREFYLWLYDAVNEDALPEWKKCIEQFYHRQGRLISCVIKWPDQNFQFYGRGWQQTHY